MAHLSTKVRSITSPTQGRSCDSQTTDHKKDAKKKKAGGDQERGKTKVNLDETQEELGDEGMKRQRMSTVRINTRILTQPLYTGSIGPWPSHEPGGRPVNCPVAPVSSVMMLSHAPPPNGGH